MSAQSVTPACGPRVGRRGRAGAEGHCLPTFQPECLSSQPVRLAGTSALPSLPSPTASGGPSGRGVASSASEASAGPCTGRCLGWAREGEKGEGDKTGCVVRGGSRGSAEGAGVRGIGGGPRRRLGSGRPAPLPRAPSTAARAGGRPVSGVRYRCSVSGAAGEGEAGACGRGNGESRGAVRPQRTREVWGRFWGAGRAPVCLRGVRAHVTEPGAGRRWLRGRVGLA